MEIDYTKTNFTKEEILEINRSSLYKGIAIGTGITLILGFVWFKYVTRNAKFDFWK